MRAFAIANSQEVTTQNLCLPSTFVCAVSASFLLIWRDIPHSPEFCLEGNHVFCEYLDNNMLNTWVNVMFEAILASFI